jgi:hypothetical protein
MELKFEEKQPHVIYCEKHTPLKLRRIFESKDKKYREDIIKFCRATEKYYETYNNAFKIKSRASLTERKLGFEGSNGKLKIPRKYRTRQPQRGDMKEFLNLIEKHMKARPEFQFTWIVERVTHHPARHTPARHTAPAPAPEDGAPVTATGNDQMKPETATLPAHDAPINSIPAHGDTAVIAIVSGGGELGKPHVEAVPPELFRLLEVSKPRQLKKKMTISRNDEIWQVLDYKRHTPKMLYKMYHKIVLDHKRAKRGFGVPSGTVTPSKQQVTVEDEAVWYPKDAVMSASTRISTRRQARKARGFYLEEHLDAAVSEDLAYTPPGRGAAPRQPRRSSRPRMEVVNDSGELRFEEENSSRRYCLCQSSWNNDDNMICKTVRAAFC